MNGKKDKMYPINKKHFILKVSFKMKCKNMPLIKGQQYVHDRLLLVQSQKYLNFVLDGLYYGT